MQKTLSIIDLTAIRRNAQRIKSLAGGRKFFAVVKADAYGHGAVEVARHIEDIVDGFCVAIVEEAISLRVAGVTQPILVLNPLLDTYDVRRARAYDLTVTVNSVKTALLCYGLPCHIKVNTGMNRLGCSVEELPQILKRIPSDCIKGVYSHLYCPEDERASESQLNIFLNAERLVKEINSGAVAHIAASGGTLRGGNFLLDGVRAGILLYGYCPSGFECDGFEPALKVYARRTQQTAFIGGGIGYNPADRMYKDISVYRCGYADGFMRNTPLGEKTLCMDAFLRDGGGKMLCVMDDARHYAMRCGTIAYEVLVNITHRSQRVYIR